MNKDLLNNINLSLYVYSYQHYLDSVKFNSYNPKIKENLTEEILDLWLRKSNWNLGAVCEMLVEKNKQSKTWLIMNSQNELLSPFIRVYFKGSTFTDYLAESYLD